LLHKIGTVFCMPSPAELQSIVALESMASGLPIVAVDAGAVKELCQDERNGFLCHKDDVKAITTGLLKILTDSKLREKMGAESLKIAKEHSIEHTLNRFEQIYKTEISAKKKQ
jgi:glycosyltransferase involved in cell wall biosynthesis